MVQRKVDIVDHLDAEHDYLGLIHGEPFFGNVGNVMLAEAGPQRLEILEAASANDTFGTGLDLPILGLSLGLPGIEILTPELGETGLSPSGLDSFRFSFRPHTTHEDLSIIFTSPEVV